MNNIVIIIENQNIISFLLFFNSNHSILESFVMSFSFSITTSEGLKAAL